MNPLGSNGLSLYKSKWNQRLQNFNIKNPDKFPLLNYHKALAHKLWFRLPSSKVNMRNFTAHAYNWMYLQCICHIEIEFACPGQY